MIAPTPGGSPFGVNLESIVAGANPPPTRHRPDEYVVNYVMRGEGVLDCGASNADGVPLRLSCGDFFVIAPGLDHSIACTSNNARSLDVLSVSVPLGNDREFAHGEWDDRTPVTNAMLSMEEEGCLIGLRRRKMDELATFQLSDDGAPAGAPSNRIAPVFDPFRDCTPFTCSMEVLDPRYAIPSHTHDTAFELFIILSGCGELVLEAKTVAGRQGAVFLVPPKTVHSVRNASDEASMYLLSLILPNEGFAQKVFNGQYSGKLEGRDLDELKASSPSSP